MSATKLRIAILIGMTGIGCSIERPAQACEALDRIVNSAGDASRALSDCLAEIAPGQMLALRPGTYTLTQPVTINKPVTITTLGVSQSNSGCAQLGATRCAVLRIDPSASVTAKNTMPVLISANGVTLDHLIIEGAGISNEQRARCRTHDFRPLGGGLRVSGSRFTIRNSALRNFACYTSLEIVKPATQPTVENNVIGPNGDHRPGNIWSDGVTVHDSSGAVVARNLFIDNTDVQLIFGGCRGCRIEDNRFRHSGSFNSSSFAELMLQAWPSTSGDYAGTIVTGNDIDCGPGRRCGYGMMIGSAPWYKGAMAGGKIVQNRISDAMIGIDVDGLSGPVEIDDNSVSNSGGRFASDCGARDWPAVNVSPASLALVRGEPSNQPKQSMSTVRCLINRQEH